MMQIESIILAFRNGTKRQIDFKLGKLNIITGASKTGKSALQDIVEYCLGSEKNLIAAGPIRDNAIWYAIILNMSGDRILIARKEPKPGKMSSEEVRLEVGKNINILDFKNMVGNTNVAGALGKLAEILGIEENIHIPSIGQSRNPISAQFHHSMIYCFQSQNELTSKKNLFHRQDESFVEVATKDTFPYLVGAVDVDYYKNKKLLSDLRLRQRELEKQIAIEKRLADSNSQRIGKLLIEARAVGLTTSDTETLTSSDAIATLKGIASVGLAKTTEIPVVESVGEEIRKLELQKKEVYANMTYLKEEIRFLKDFQDVSISFDDEAKEQVSRLQTLAIFEDSNTSDQCPFCGSQHDQIPEAEKRVKASILKLQDDMGALASEKSSVTDYLLKDEASLTALRDQYRNLQASLENLIAQRSNFEGMRLESNMKANVLGRISLFLDAVQEVSPNDVLSKELGSVERQIVELEMETAGEHIQSNLNSAAAIISSYIDRWSKELNMEHSEHPFRFDLHRFSVVADRASSPIPFVNMGSGENWIAMHIIVHYAMHRLFIERNRPVPAFLMLDQPSQSQFPVDKDIANDGSLVQIGEDDRAIIERMFKFLYDKVAECDGRFQVIVTDHASIALPWYQESIVDVWRNGKKLVMPENISEA